MRYNLREFNLAVKNYLDRNKKIKKRKVARDPVTGYWAEREINPICECRLLYKIGFSKVSLIHLSKEKKRPRYKKLIIQYLSKNAWPLLFFDTHFTVEATK